MEALSMDELMEALESEEYLESREKYVARKMGEGFKIFTPSVYELALDIDSQEAWETFLVRWKRMFDEGIVGDYKVFDSSTPGHKHIIVKIGMNLDPLERIAFQAVLGSDLVREFLSILRYYHNDPFPTILAMKADPNDE